MPEEYDYRAEALTACSNAADNHYPGLGWSEDMFDELENKVADKLSEASVPELELFVHSIGNYRLWRWRTTCQGQDVTVLFQTCEEHGSFPMMLHEPARFGDVWALT